MLNRSMHDPVGHYSYYNRAVLTRFSFFKLTKEVLLRILNAYSLESYHDQS